MFPIEPSIQVEHIKSDMQRRFKNMGIKSFSISSESTDAEADFTSTGKSYKRVRRKQLQRGLGYWLCKVNEERSNSHVLSSFILVSRMKIVYT